MNRDHLDDLKTLAEELVANHQRFMRSLVQARKAQNLSQEDVAYRMNVSQSAVSQFERYDSSPTLRTIRSYAMAIGVGLCDDVIHRDTEWTPLVSKISDLTPLESSSAITSQWVSTRR